MYSNMENISSVISKKSEKLRFFEPFYMVAVVGTMNFRRWIYESEITNKNFRKRTFEKRIFENELSKSEDKFKYWLCCKIVIIGLLIIISYDYLFIFCVFKSIIYSGLIDFVYVFWL